MTPIQRLREEYKKFKSASDFITQDLRGTTYQAMRNFALDCGLVSFNEIEVMEYEENN